MSTTSEDKKILRNITAKIRRIIKNDLHKINNENAQFFLMQAFLTVDSFLSRASSELPKKSSAAKKKTKKSKKSEVVHDEG